MPVAIAVALLVLGSILFHLFSPWWLTPIASNWGSIDDALIVTLYICAIAFVALNLFLAYAIFKYRNRPGSRAHYEPENAKLEKRLTLWTGIGIAAEAREHILEGLKIAVDNIDEVVALIKASPDTETARAQLEATFELSEKQAQAILDMRLARLTGLEIEKLEKELEEVRALITELKAILASRERRLDIIKEELRELAKTFGDERRTEIVASAIDHRPEDVIAVEEMDITVSHRGYIKRLPVDTYRAQRRGGRGLQGMITRDEDWVEHLFTAQTHDYIMFFTCQGHCYWLKVHEIPDVGPGGKGKAIANLVSMEPGERIAALLTAFGLVAKKGDGYENTAIVEPLTGDLIRAEVLRGFASQSDYLHARRLLNTLACEDMLGREVADRSASYYRQLRRRGITVRKTIDALIATFCILRGYSLLHADRDFDAMERELGLEVWAAG
jgi:predicted nucleic acid-binding protein/uncharacterized coiled-coil protein SlyX